MNTPHRPLRLNRLAAMLAAAGCIAAPLATQAVTIIGDSGPEVVDVPTTSLGSPDTLILGNQATGDGVLTFRSGTLNVDHAISGGYSGFVTVGNSGTGSLFQNDFVSTSTINITGPRYAGPAPGDTPAPWGGYLFIGRNDGGSGTYVMEGGTNGGVTLNVEQDIQIGGSNVSELPGGGFSCLTGCVGTFIQRAGAVTARDVTLGIGAGTGTYAIEGGMLNAITLDLGNTSAGDNRFTQTGGTVTLGGMFIANGDGSNGTYTFEDGVLNSGAFAQIGLQGTGQFIHTGGVHNAGDVSLGYQSTGTGTYELSGGTMNVGVAAVYDPAPNPSDPPVLRPGTGTGSLLVGDTGHGVFNMTGGTLNILNDNINVAAFVVGDQAGSNGVFNQSGGDVNGGRALAIGLHGGTGVYNLNTGNNPTLTVGFIALGNNSGQGTFNQQADTTNNTGSLFVGAQGIYNLAGGALKVAGTDIGQGTIVGTSGAGALFNQSGGTHTTNNLVVGNRSDGLGTYVMTAGDLAVNGRMYIGLGHDGLPASGQLNGLFQQSGGNVTAAQIFVGGFTEVIGTGPATTFISHFGTGRYEISGGTVASGFTVIGKSGNGTVLQTGGTFDAGILHLGDDGLFSSDNGHGGFDFYSKGTYNLQGGVLNTTGTTVSTFGLGTFNQSGGTHTVNGDLIVGFGPAQTEPNSGQVRDGVYNLSAGDLVVSGVTTIGLGNGFGADPGFPGEPGARGTFNQSGGTATYNGDVVVGGFGTVAGGNGTYLMNGPGSLLVDNGASMVVAAQGAHGSFQQSDGSVTVTGFLTVGEDAGAVGTYALSNGNLSASNTIIGGGFIGTPGAGGAGSFAQSGGTFQTGFLNIGGGGFTQKGQGTYTLTNGTLTVDGSLNLGNDVGGTGTFTQSSGSVAVNGTAAGDNGLYVNNGSYTISGGTLVAANKISVGVLPGAVGALNVAGGAVTAPLIVNGGSVNYSGGSITANIANNAQVNVSGSAARTLTGDLSNNSGGVLNVAAASPLLITGVLTNNAAASIVANANITIGTDYNNLAAGSGNAYNRRANVTGAGQIQATGAGAATAQTLSGNVSGASVAGATMDFGNLRVGAASTLNYAIGNANTGGPALRGAIQTSSGQGANITDSRLTGAGVSEGSWGQVAAGGASSNLGVTFTASSAGALTGQKVGIINNFENTNSQLLSITGAAFNLAVGGATPTPVVLANQRVGGNLIQGLTVTNSAASGGFSEALNASFAANIDQATNNGGAVNNLIAGGNSIGVMGVGVNTATAGAKTGTVTLNYQSDGTGPNGNSGLAAIAAGSQTINVSGKVYNMAVGSTAPAPIVFANRHVGDLASQVLTVTNTAATGGFSEALNASFSGTSGNALHNSGSFNNLAAGTSNNSAMSVSLDTSSAGARSGSVTLAYMSDGTGSNGNSGLTAIAAGTQTVSVSGDVYRLASVNAIAAVNFGNVHVGDSVNQALSITNTASNDGFSEKLNASFGGTSDARITTSGSFALLAAGQSNASSLIVGLNTAAAGSVNGTARVLLTSDGAGTSGLGTTALTPQDVGVSGEITTSGSVFRLASASPVAPNPVNFGNVRVGASTDQALTITNTAANDGFSEKLNASIGGATAGVTSNGGAFTLLAAQGSNSTSLRVGLDTSSAGAKNGSATISLVSDGAGTSNLGQTTLPTQTVTITGGVYNMAVGVATPDPIVMNRRVNDVATQTLTVSNNAAAGLFSEALNASFSASAGNAAHNSGGISNLIAGGSDASAMSVSLNTTTAGAKSGTVTLAYQTDGTGSNGHSGLNAIAAGTQTISVTGNVYTAAIGQVLPSTSINFGVVHVGDVVGTIGVGVKNNAAATALNDQLTGTITLAGGPFSASGHLGAGLGAGQTDSSSLRVGVNTSAAGVLSGSANVNLSSHNAEMADLLLGSTTVDLQAQVNNYANLDIIRIPGLGTFTRSGNVFTLNLGAFALGSGTQSATLNVKNAVSGPADAADGGFCLPGSPCSTDAVLDFALGGFSGFHDLQAGDSTGDLTIGFNTLAVGTYEDDIDLGWFGKNANWTQDGLTHYTLRILGSVYDGTGTVPEPGNLALVLTALGLAAAATRRRRVRSSFGQQPPCAAKRAA